MKTIHKLIAVVVGLLFLVALWIWVDVYVFEDGSMYTTLPTESLAVQRIEAVGEDFRVYEFKLKSVPNKICAFAAAETKGGLFCFDVPPEVGVNK